MPRWIWSISECNLTWSMTFVRWHSPSQALIAKHVLYPCPADRNTLIYKKMFISRCPWWSWDLTGASHLVVFNKGWKSSNWVPLYPMRKIQCTISYQPWNEGENVFCSIRLSVCNSILPSVAILTLEPFDLRLSVIRGLMQKIWLSRLTGF